MHSDLTFTPPNVAVFFVVFFDLFAIGASCSCSHSLLAVSDWVGLMIPPTYGYYIANQISVPWQAALTSTHALAQLLCSPIIGRSIDTYGRKAVFVLSFAGNNRHSLIVFGLLLLLLLLLFCDEFFFCLMVLFCDFCLLSKESLLLLIPKAPFWPIAYSASPARLSSSSSAVWPSEWCATLSCSPGRTSQNHSIQMPSCCPLRTLLPSQALLSC
jgi:MFS family permease